MQHAIRAPGVLEIALNEGEALFSAINAMLWMDVDISMTSNRKEGLLSGLKRALSDFSFRVDYTARKPARLAFATRLPGTILPVRMSDDQILHCRREVLLCAEASVQAAIDPGRSVGALKADDGLLWRLRGPGMIFLGLQGEPIERDLAAGDAWQVSAAHLAMLEARVGLRLTWLAGFENKLAGENGLPVATLRGPGRVVLQSAPIIPVAEDVGRLVPHSE